jgi:hypothetical protein
MTYTLYDTLGDKTTTFYYDDELQDWDESPYKMVDVTSKLRSNP